MTIVSGCGKKAQNPQEGLRQSGQTEVVTGTESMASHKDTPLVTTDKQIGDYTTEFISKYIDSGEYYLKTDVTENGQTKSVEIAVSGERAALRDERGVKITDGGSLYFVLHDKKTVLTSPVAESMKEDFASFILERQVSGVKELLVYAGKEALNGQEFSVEEFKNGNKTIKYYYDDKTLRFVNEISADGAVKLTQVLELTHSIPADIFDVPDDYTVQDLSMLQG